MFKLDILAFSVSVETLLWAVDPLLAPLLELPVDPVEGGPARPLPRPIRELRAIEDPTRLPGLLDIGIMGWCWMLWGPESGDK